MNEEDIKNLIKALEPYLNQKMKETVSHAKNSLLSEDSNLALEVKSSHSEIKSRLESIDERIKTANGYTAKHEQRLNTQDIFNAQTTMTQTQTLKSLDEMLVQLKESSKKLEELNQFKNEANGSLLTFKWIFGFVGLGTLLSLIKLFLP